MSLEYTYSLESANPLPDTNFFMFFDKTQSNGVVNFYVKKYVSEDGVTNIFKFDPAPYNYEFGDSTFDFIDGDQCIFSYSSSENKIELNFLGSRRIYKTDTGYSLFSGGKSHSLNDVLSESQGDILSVLNANYYASAEYELVYKFEDKSSYSSPLAEGDIYVSPEGFNLPDLDQFLDALKQKCDDGDEESCGSGKFFVKLKSDEMKCDFDRSGGLKRSTSSKEINLESSGTYLEVSNFNIEKSFNFEPSHFQGGVFKMLISDDDSPSSPEDGKSLTKFVFKPNLINPTDSIFDSETFETNVEVVLEKIVDGNVVDTYISDQIPYTFDNIPPQGKVYDTSRRLYIVPEAGHQSVFSYRLPAGEYRISLITYPVPVQDASGNIIPTDSTEYLYNNGETVELFCAGDDDTNCDGQISLEEEYFDQTLKIELESEYQVGDLSTVNTFSLIPKISNINQTDPNLIFYTNLTFKFERFDITGNGENEEFKSGNYSKFYYTLPVSTEVTQNTVFDELDILTQDLLRAGKYKVSVTSKPIRVESTLSDDSYDFTNVVDTTLNLNGINYVNLFCEANDTDCDSIPDRRDVCSRVYGSAYFLGCPSEYLENDVPVINRNLIKLDKKLTNCEFDTGSFFDATGDIQYDSNLDIITCNANGLTFGEEFFNFNGLDMGTDVIQNPNVGTYICNNRDYKYVLFKGWVETDPDFLAKCDLEFESEDLPEYIDLNRGDSVFDSDKDLVPYQPKWWSDQFRVDRATLDVQDRCPSSYGLPIDNGCPVTNEEDKIQQGDLVAHDDIFENKLYFDQETGQITFDGTEILVKNIKKQIPVEVSTSCIPTIRLSKLVETNDESREILEDKLDGAVFEDPDDAVNLEEFVERSDRIKRDLSTNEQKELYQKLTENSDCDVPINRVDNLSAFSLLSALHYITPVDSSDKTLNLINDVINRSINITFEKEIDPNDSGANITTRIRLRLYDIPANTTIWQVIPKENIIDFDRFMTTVTKGNSDAILVKDRDPIIGWYFGDGGDSGDLEFVIDGTGEGGSTIPTNSSLNYNFGELIVNYREGGCFSSENEIFTATNLTQATVQNSGLTYSVCLAHNESQIITNEVGSFNETFFSIQSNKLDFETSSLTTNVYLYKDNASKYYAVDRGLYPPNKGYSCVGSTDEDGLFGDCIYYPENRIWMYYGPDPFPPEIELSTYLPANTISFMITIEDPISGVDWSTPQYCIVNETGICNYISYSQNDQITVSCPELEGCAREIRVRAMDNEGNWGELIEDLVLLQAGSACTNECLALPTPGRFINTCRNVNGCKYFPLSDEDDGRFVADACHYKVPGSWVDIGASLQVKCPNGPVRASQLSDLDFDVDSETCDQISSKQFPVLVDGEEVIMYVLSCN